MTERRGKATGFTLVEILVVCAVVSILAMLPLGGFFRVRERGRASVCQNNEKQIYLAFQGYLQDHDLRFPPPGKWYDALQPYLKSTNVLLCPSVTYHSEELPDVDYRVISRRIHQISIAPSGKRIGEGVIEAAITQPSLWPILIDSAEEPDVQNTRYPRECSLKMVGTPNGGSMFPVMHNGGGNTLFADGHTKWMKPAAAVETSRATANFSVRRK